MSRHFRTILGLDLRFHAQRPLTWVLLILLALMSFFLSSGNVSIVSGDSTVGGQSKAWITSEFAVAQVFPLLVFLIYIFLFLVRTIFFEGPAGVFRIRFRRIATVIYDELHTIRLDFFDVPTGFLETC